MMDAFRRLRFEMTIDDYLERLPIIAKTSKKTFDSLIEEGFDEDQALFLTAEMMAMFAEFDETEEEFIDIDEEEF
jgi:hypothetical protein